MIWRLTHNPDVVSAIVDGKEMSCLVTRKEYQDFLAAGGVPLDAIPEPPISQDEIDSIAARDYAKLKALVRMDPAEVQAWVTANVTTLTQARDAISTLAVAISVLARKL